MASPSKARTPVEDKPAPALRAQASRTAFATTAGSVLCSPRSRDSAAIVYSDWLTVHRPLPRAKVPEGRKAATHARLFSGQLEQDLRTAALGPQLRPSTAPVRVEYSNAVRSLPSFFDALAHGTDEHRHTLGQWGVRYVRRSVQLVCPCAL